ncbi:MAG TPA: hypothetical protein VKF36_04800 [Syntrophorhabdales bacterium]|nr:hypothetical protein [Syntrophorhabdales bacterium]
MHYLLVPNEHDDMPRPLGEVGQKGPRSSPGFHRPGLSPEALDGIIDVDKTAISVILKA